MPAHRFDDLVALAFTEIRDYGRTSIQVLRRLRAALVELESSVLPEYAAADRGRARAARPHRRGRVRGHAGRRALSALADRQGIGGPPRLDGTAVTVANDRPTL